MKIVKRINNNTVLCRDSRNREVVAFGKGIAFAAPKGSDELPLSAIERTFYNIDDHYIALLDELDSRVLTIAADIVEAASPSLGYKLSPNATLALADHISFAIERQRKGIVVRMPLSYDVQQMHPVEYQAAKVAIDQIERDLNINLPREELTGIALCLVNSAFAPTESENANQDAVEDDSRIEAITEFIERRYGTVVDRDGFEFARFATHMHYLLNRIRSGADPLPGDPALYETARQTDEQAARCADMISAKLEHELSCTISNEERLYLLLHINRVASKRR